MRRIELFLTIANLACVVIVIIFVYLSVTHAGPQVYTTNVFEIIIYAISALILLLRHGDDEEGIRIFDGLIDRRKVEICCVFYNIFILFVYLVYPPKDFSYILLIYLFIFYAVPAFLIFTAPRRGSRIFDVILGTLCTLVFIVHAGGYLSALANHSILSGLDYFDIITSAVAMLVNAILCFTKKTH
jgi:hypothetical protein